MKNDTRLKNLALIRGPFRLETAQAIGQADLGIITKLIDKSLVQSSAGSDSEETTALNIYSLHELTRHYASELLKESVNDWEKAQVRYQKWFVDLLTQQLDSMYGPEQFAAAENIHFSYNDMLYAWQESINQFRWNDLDLVKATNAIGIYFRSNGFFRLGADVFGKALDILPTAAPAELRMTMQLRYAAFLFGLSNYGEAEKVARMALEIAEENQFVPDLRKIQLVLGQIAWKAGRATESLEFGKSSLKIAEELDSKYSRAVSHNFIGTSNYTNGQFADAFFHYEEALKLFNELGHEDYIWLVKSNMALPAVMVGQYEQAIEVIEKELGVARRWRNKQRLAVILLNLAWVRSFVKDYGRADDEIDESLVYYRETGNAEGEATAFIVMGHIDAVQGDYIPARAHFLDALRISHRIQAIPKLVETIAGLALFLYELDGQNEIAWKVAKFCQTQAVPGSMGYNRAETVLERIGDQIPAEKHAELLAESEAYNVDDVTMALMHHQLDKL